MVLLISSAQTIYDREVDRNGGLLLGLLSSDLLVDSPISIYSYVNPVVIHCLKTELTMPPKLRRSSPLPLSLTPWSLPETHLSSSNFELDELESHLLN